MRKARSVAVAIVSMGIVLGSLAGADATTINFSGESIGPKPNGYTIGIASFSDTIGSGLFVGDFGNQSHGLGLAIESDDASKLQIDFALPVENLSLAFGNDDPDPCCSGPGDLAILLGYLNGSFVSQSTVVMNRNDLMDQTIGLGPQAINEAFFYYGDSALSPIGLTEVVDDISFQVPLPSTLLLFVSGLVVLGLMRRGRNDVASISDCV